MVQARKSKNVALIDFILQIVHSLTPLYLRQACTIIPHNTDNYQLRRNNSFHLPIIKKEIFSKSCFPKPIRDLNTLSTDIKQSVTVTEFKTKIKIYMSLLRETSYFHTDTVGLKLFTVDCV